MLIRELLREQNPDRAMDSSATTWSDFLEAVPRLQASLDALDQGTKIYRGVPFKGIPVRYKPQMTPGYRKSANIPNYYTLLIDNSDKWTKYPARSASVIATTDMDYADYFGESYLVLPEGDPLVGVCSGGDFWESFPYLTSQIPVITSLEDLVLSLTNIFRSFIPKSSHTVASHTDLMDRLEKIDQIWQEYSASSDLALIELGLYDTSLALLRYGDAHMSMEQKLDDLLDPHKNNFAVAHWSNLDVYMHGNYEVWFSAPVWMISTDHLPQELNRTTLLNFVQSQVSSQ